MKTETLIHHGRKTNIDYTNAGKGEKTPVVLFCHGYNGYMTDFDNARKLLSDNGLSSASIAFSGGSTRDESGFPSTEMTLFTEKEDLLALIEWTQKQTWVDERKIFLYGASMGGLVSCMAAQEVQEKICALILLFPALCIVDDWNERFENESEIPDEMMFWNLRLGKEYFVSMRHLNVFEILSKIKLNTLIFHGTDDRIVPVRYSEKAERVISKAELKSFDGEGHGFSREANEKADRMLLDFVIRNA